MNLFTRARANLNLAPGERAVLRLVDLCTLAGLIAALPVISDALANQPVNWSAVAHTAIAAFSVAALGALLKWLKAQTDAPLPSPVAIPAPAPTSNDTPVAAAALSAPSSDAVRVPTAPLATTTDGYVPAATTAAPAAS